MKDSTLMMVMCVVGIAFGGVARGQAADDAADKRVEQLEKKVDMLEKLLGLDGESPDAKGKARIPAKGFAVWSNLDIEVYGYIKMDAAYDSARTSAGNFARWVNSEAMNTNDDQFNMTANQTRLGIKITNPNDDKIKTFGRVEVDFYGNGAGENKPGILVRHAYLQLDFPRHKVSLIAGQTSDVISPLVPATVNYTVNWWCGNIGYRRPQIRVTKICDVDDGSFLTFQGAVTRDIGHATINGLDPGDSGEDAGAPGVQARVAVTTPLIDGRQATLGLSGHFQSEEYDIAANGRHKNLCSWSGNIDVLLPVSETVTLKAEGFFGQNLDTFFGGIGQGIEVTTIGVAPAPVVVTQISEIRSMGGWVAATCDPEGPWAFNVGASGEMINEDDVAVATTRTTNSSVFLNTFYKITDNALVAFEISGWRTTYKRGASGNSLRCQIAFIYGL